jgi:hypothetical protein
MRGGVMRLMRPWKTSIKSLMILAKPGTFIRY